MNDKEYISILEYLISKLREINAANIADEIIEIVNQGKTINIDDSDLKIAKIKQSEVGKTQTVAFNGKESLTVAIDFLSKVTLDVSLYHQKITNKLGDNVIWSYDQKDTSFQLGVNQDLNLKDLIFSIQEIDTLKIEFEKLKRNLDNGHNV